MLISNGIIPGLAQNTLSTMNHYGAPGIAGAYNSLQRGVALPDYNSQNGLTFSFGKNAHPVSRRLLDQVAMTMKDDVGAMSHFDFNAEQAQPVVFTHPQLEDLTAYCWDVNMAAINGWQEPAFPAGVPDQRHQFKITWKGGDENINGYSNWNYDIKPFSDVLEYMTFRYSGLDWLNFNKQHPSFDKELTKLVQKKGGHPNLSVELSFVKDLTPIANPLHWTPGKDGLEISYKVNNVTYNPKFFPDEIKANGWNQMETLFNLVKKSSRGSDNQDHMSALKYLLDNNLITARRFETYSQSMTYDEYLGFKGQSGEPLFEQAGGDLPADKQWFGFQKPNDQKLMNIMLV